MIITFNKYSNMVSYIFYDLHEELQKYRQQQNPDMQETSNTNNNNKHQIRDEYRKLLIESLGLPQLEATDLEIGVFNAALDYASNTKIQLSWKCQLFTDIYVNIARSMYANLKEDSYIQNDKLKKRLLESKEFLPHMLPYMLNEDIFPERWKNIVEKNKRRLKAAYEIKQVAMTDQIQCSRCKSKKISYYELQTRSGDEAMTQFMCCITCGKKWKM